jgi:hypothetical protein
MSHWFDWLALAISLGLMGVGLRDRQHGNRLVIVSAILALTSAAHLVPESWRVAKYAFQGAAIALLVYTFATTSKETYRKTRVELSMFLGAVALIGLLQIPSLPRPLEIALLIVFCILLAAVPVLAIARATRPGH